MSASKFKTLRHMETVRNFLNLFVREILRRGEFHDQSKLQPPEVDVFEEFTPKLRDLVYGSNEYRECLRQMKPAIEHHNQVNRHHPEHFPEGLAGMNLIDLLEMLADWKAAGMRHNTGDLMKSIEINRERFGMDDQVYNLLKNTAVWMAGHAVYNYAEES